jgi:hypothetical protein
VRKIREKAAASLWGRAGLEVAGFRMLFESDSAGIINIFGRRYGRFASSGRGGCKFSVFEVPGKPAPFKPAIVSGKNSLVVKRGDFQAELDLGTGAGTLKAAPTEQCLDAFLRSFLSSRLLSSGGLMLHSAGIVIKGRAYLFLGKSGAGKSTLSRLAAAAGVEVISDEINLLRPGPGGLRVYGSPFWGEMRADGRQGSWPLGGIFILKKAKANGTFPCSKAEALKLLLRCLLNFDKSPAAGELIISNAVRLLGKAGFRRLEFTKTDAAFLELI